VNCSFFQVTRLGPFKVGGIEIDRTNSHQNAKSFHEKAG
jgi:hypothetical protein